MAYARIISGVLREVFQEAIPQGAVAQTVLTTIRMAPGQLSRIRGFLKIDSLTGIPTVTAVASVVNGRLQVAVANAAAGTDFTWTLDVMLTQSSQQGTDATAGAVIMIVQSAAASASAGDLVFASLADGSIVASTSHSAVGPIGAGSPNCLLAGTGAVIGAGCAGSVAMGYAAHIYDGASASVILGSLGAGPPNLIFFNSLQSVAIGSGNIIGVNSPKCISIGSSGLPFTIGTGCTASIVHGNDCSIGDTSPDCMVFGHASVVGNVSVFTTVLGSSITVGGGGGYQVALGQSLTLGLRGHVNVVIGASNSFGDDADWATFIGSNITHPDDPLATVAIGHDITFAAAAVNNAVLGGYIATVDGNHNVLIGSSTSLLTVAMVCSASVLVLGLQIQADFAIAIGDQAQILNGGAGDAAGSVALGALATVTCAGTAAGIAIGYQAAAGDNQCVIGDGNVVSAINELVVRGWDGAALIDTLKAISNPAVNETGLFVTYNTGVATTSKLVKAAVAPPGGSLLLYIDP